MVGEISGVTKTEVLRAIRNRYKDASKKDKSRMLDEFVAIVGCHRKHAVRLLRRGDELTPRSVPKGQRIYDEAVKEALRLRTDAAKRFKRVDRAIAVIWKMLMVAENRFRRLKASELMKDVFLGAVYKDGIVIEPTPEKVAAWSRLHTH